MIEQSNAKPLSTQLQKLLRCGFASRHAALSVRWAFAVVWAVEAARLRSETAIPCGLGPARLRVRALGLLRCSPHGWLGLRQIHALTALGLQCVVGAGAGWASAPCRAASVRLPAPASPGGPLGPFVWVPPACLACVCVCRVLTLPRAEADGRYTDREPAVSGYRRNAVVLAPLVRYARSARSGWSNTLKGQAASGTIAKPRGAALKYDRRGSYLRPNGSTDR